MPVTQPTNIVESKDVGKFLYIGKMDLDVINKHMVGDPTITDNLMSTSNISFHIYFLPHEMTHGSYT